MSADRVIHLIVGVLFFLVFLKLSNIKIDIKVVTYGFIAMAIGTWVPDWDLFLGIGFHRSPISHSALPAVILGWIIFKFKLPPVLFIGFCLGLSSHLFWDIIYYGNVQWISGGSNDRLFLFINSAILVVISKVVSNRTSHIRLSRA